MESSAPAARLQALEERLKRLTGSRKLAWDRALDLTKMLSQESARTNELRASLAQLSAETHQQKSEIIFLEGIMGAARAHAAENPELARHLELYDSFKRMKHGD